MEEQKRNMKFTHERRKEWKKASKHSLKTHYVLLLVTVAIAGVLGVQKGYFVDTQTFSDSRVTSYADNEAGVSAAGAVLEAIIYSNTEEGQTLTQEEKNESIFSQFLYEGKYKNAEDMATAESEKYSKGKTTNAVAGRKYGIFAGIVNDVSSGTLIVRIAKAVNTIVRSSEASIGLVIALAMIGYILIWIFILNVYRAVMRRIFLEARLYQTVNTSHFFFFKSVGKWGKAAKTMLRYQIQLFLWSLTIVGAFIKYYSYWLVPYIVAENPDIEPKEAIRLSRVMMNGRKWETFKYECTFIGWEILSYLTFGLLQMFFVAPYKLATDAEVYAVIRQECKEDRYEGIDQLNDYYLFEKVAPELLEKKYSDIIASSAEIESKRIKLTGVKKFFADNFGLWIGKTKDQLEYESYEAAALSVRKAKACADGRAYPVRLNKLWEESFKNIKLDKSKEFIKSYNAMKTYSIWIVISFFFIFAFIGWSWEVLIHIVKDGVFVNRGTLHGPWLPIYGGGGVMILLVLKRFRDRPWLEAISAIVLCGVLEYFASYYLEVTKGIRWWDYTGYFLNLNGRICGEGLMVFAIGGCAIVYLAAPALDRMLQKINLKILVPICVILVGCFVGDVIYTKSHPNIGAGVTDYTHYKEVVPEDEAEEVPAEAAQ